MMVHRKLCPAPLLSFAFLATGVYTIAMMVVDQLPRLEAGAGLVALALTIDMVVVVPLVFYLLVVRGRGLPVVSLVPVVVASVLAALWVIPADRQQALHVLEALAIPLELGLMGWVVLRVTRAMREVRRDARSEPLEQLQRAAFDLTRNGRAAAILATEIAVLWYALGSWRSSPHVPSGSADFTHHRRSGHAGLVFAIILVMSVESVVVHVLLMNWNSIAAWVLTVASAYGALWLLADYRATVLRPILVSDRDVRIRAGLRGSVCVPRSQVAVVSRSKPQDAKDSVNLTFLGSPSHWLILSAPTFVDGPYGLSRRVRSIGIEPDRPAEFEISIGKPAG